MHKDAPIFRPIQQIGIIRSHPLLGGLAFGFLVPALAGYIAFAIADRPGIAPGFTAGAVAVFVGAGFIGGIVGGLIAGFAALGLGVLCAFCGARLAYLNAEQV